MPTRGRIPREIAACVPEVKLCTVIVANCNLLFLKLGFILLSDTLLAYYQYKWSRLECDGGACVEISDRAVSFDLTATSLYILPLSPTLSLLFLV